MKNFESFGRSSRNAAEKLQVKSALNPMLWLCGIALPTCLLAAWALREVPVLSFLIGIVGVLPVVVTCIVSVYFALKKPEFLQSEEYQLKHQALSIMQERSEHVLDAASLEILVRELPSQLPEQRRLKMLEHGEIPPNTPKGDIE